MASQPQAEAVNVAIRVWNGANTQCHPPICLLLGSCLEEGGKGLFYENANVDQDIKKNSNKFLLDQPDANQVWKTKIELYFSFGLQ